MQIRRFGGGRAPRIDDHQPQLRSLLAQRQDPLHQHRMAPGEVRPDQHQQISLVQIGVLNRHDIFTEGAHMPGHGRGHAQPRVGIDVRGADVALHQLVGDVVVLRQQLTGNIQRHGIRPVLVDAGAQRDRPRRTVRYPSLTLAPSTSGYSSRPCVTQRGSQRRALGAESTEVGGMVGIAAHCDAAVGGALREHAAAHPAVGACGTIP